MREFLKKQFYTFFGMFSLLLKKSERILRENQYRKRYNLDKSVRFHENVILEGNLEIGEGTEIQRNCVISSGKKTKVKIGKYCAIARGANIRGKAGGADYIKYENKEKDIEIGNYVWLGVNVFIREGVKIGDNSIIGANSVVTKDIPSNTIVGGVPAKPLKKIQNEIKKRNNNN